MKFSINAQELKRAVGILKGVGLGSSMPILFCLHFKATEENGAKSVTITATDLAVTCRVGYEVSGEFEPGEACINGKTLHKMLSGADKNTGDIQIQTTGTAYAAMVVSGDVCRIGADAVLAAEDFPAFPDLGKATASDAWDSFVEDLSIAAPTMSTDDTRPHLAGALIRSARDEREEEDDGDKKTIVEEKTVVVSTDGHRLTKIEHPFARSPGFDFILRSFAVGFVQKLSKLSAVRSILTAPENDAIVGDGWVVVQRHLDAAFPAYNQVIPATSENTLRFDISAENLAKCIKKARAMAGTEDRVEGIALTVSADAPPTLSRDDNGSANAFSMPFPAMMIHQKSIRIGFNMRYAAELAEVADGLLRFEINGELDPIRVDWRTKTGTPCTCVVMPMRV